MTIQGNYIGMALEVSDLDVENVEYFRHCAAHDYHLQRCDDCALVRYPPTTACPWCASPKSSWVAVEAKGTVHSYVEVHHAIQPAFKSKLPYMILLVDLDTQKGKPSEHEALRVVGNLCDNEGRAGSGRRGQEGRHRHPRQHGVRRRGTGTVDPALDDRRGGEAARQPLALPGLRGAH